MIDVHSIAAKSSLSNPNEWLPFSTHMYDTANMIVLLFQHWLPESVRMRIATSLGLGNTPDDMIDRASDYCRLAALLHDIGKLTPIFQAKIADSISGYRNYLNKSGLNSISIVVDSTSPHAAAGAEILRINSFPESFCEIVGSHHGKYNGKMCSDIDVYPEYFYGQNKCDKMIWNGLWKNWIAEALKETQFSIDKLPETDVPCQMLITGLLIMADWIASNTYYFPLLPYDQPMSIQSHYDRADTAWEKLAFTDLLNISPLNTNWFKELFGFQPNSVQKMMMDAISRNPVPGIYILEAPMGIGKTEAALAAAELLIQKMGLGGIYFGLPTQATANGVFGRIKAWAEKLEPEKHTIRLAHGMTELNDEYQSLFHGSAADAPDEDKMIVHSWFEGRKQALLSEFVIATVDQFLLASLKQKHVMLRHLGLAGKAVIIDECHAYDAYMNVYLDHALTWMGAYGIPVIILSATLPQQRRTQLLHAYLKLKQNQPLTYADETAPYAYPVLTWTSGQNVSQTALVMDSGDKVIQVDHIAEQALAKDLASRLKDGGCAGIIVNTVAYAQQLAIQLEAALPGYEILCFHSRFIATDRAIIEKALLSRVGKHSNPQDRNRLIVVGTQVLEQSLDLDFDYMVTELCPMDLLLQRSGRQHRHQRVRPKLCTKPVLSILKPTEEQYIIYDKWILQQTAKQLPEELHIPSCIPQHVEAVYRAEDENDPQYQEYRRKISDKRAKATGYCIKSEKLGKKRYNLLSDFLDDDLGGSVEAEASVRDAEETIETLVLCRMSDNNYRLVSGKAVFDETLPLTEDEAKQIVRERLRLPLSFSKYHFSETVKALNVMPDKWRESRWLNGELLLLLDENMKAELLGKTLQYSSKYGLREVKEG